MKNKNKKSYVNNVDVFLLITVILSCLVSFIQTLRIFELKKTLYESSGVFLCTTELQEEPRVMLNETLEGAKVDPCYGCMEDYSPFCFTDEEEELIAHVLMAEAEGEGITGKELVLHVILNRILSPRFPDTVEGVVYQDLAFSCVLDDRISEVQPDTDCYDLIDDVQKVYFDVSGGATYFCTEPESAWHDSALRYLYTWKNHRFYCERDLEGVI